MNDQKKALIVDWGDVYVLGPTPVSVFKEQFNKTERERVDSIWNAEVKPELHMLTRGEITAEMFWKHVGKAYGIDVDGKKLEETASRDRRVNEGLALLIKKAKRNGTISAMLTNNAREWFEKWKAQNGQQLLLFDQVIASYDIGMRKPDENIYRYALENLQVEPANCFFVDNKPRNVEAAVKIGMNGFVYNPEQVENSNRELARRLISAGML
jgi:putative hydrolase of the HAD superfamily